MTRIRFEDLPSTNTPRNAENLNKLNNVIISPTEPTTGEEVWIQKSNNVFNEEYAKNASNYAKFGTLTSVGYNSTPIYLEPNTTYTFSRTDNAGLGSGYYCLLKLDGNTNASSDDNSKWIIHNTTANQNNQNFTFTTLDNGLVLLTVGYEDNLTQNTLNNIWAVLKEVQIEKGEMSTTYEPYVAKKIYTKNDNGGYEEFYKSDIVESGSNENGSYIKYADGRMECYGVLTLTNFDLQHTYEGVYYNYETINLPSIFVNSDYVIVEGCSSPKGLPTTRTNNKKTTSFDVTIENISKITFESIDVNYVAKGRWK